MFEEIDKNNKYSSSVYSEMFENSKFRVYSPMILFGYSIPDRANLVSPIIFKMFPNLKELTINTMPYYAFNLLFFLQNISTSSKWKKITIEDWMFVKKEGAKVFSKPHWNSTGGWMANLWNNSSDQIEAAYMKKELNIQFHKSDVSMRGIDEQTSTVEGISHYERLIITRIKRSAD